MAKLNLKDALNTSLARTKLYIDTELAKKADSSHGTHLTLGTGSGNAFRGDYGNTAYQHSQAAHAPSNAQKNSDITKAEIEAKLTGVITSHTHSLQTTVSGNAGSANKVNNNLVVKLNGGTTEGTNMFTFNGSAAKTINITPSSIGAAADHSHNDYINKNAFANIKVGNVTVGADTVQDTIELVAGSNVTITPDATSDKITITAKDTVYTHPSSHAATMITEDTSHRFVTDTEKAAWNAKSSLALGTTSSTAFRGDYGNTAYTHATSAHAPSNAQKNSDITKAEIEAKLTGAITSHTHTLANIGAVSQTDVNNTIKNKFIVLTQAEYDAITTKTTDAIYFIKA